MIRFTPLGFVNVFEVSMDSHRTHVGNVSQKIDFWKEISRFFKHNIKNGDNMKLLQF